MKRSGPDSLNSWIIACACCFINMMMFGMGRLSGVLFVASVSRFGVPRQKASLPYTFSTFIRSSSGPLVGFLGHKFGLRLVTTIGCILGAIGIGTCFFAENISTVTILWGAMFGLGYGLGNGLLPVCINQHFDKHRTTASGISYSGACLGSFVLPPIVDILMNNYGLSGAYLFLSGFILNCVPAALLLNKPNLEINKGTQKVTEDCERETQSIVSGLKVELHIADDSSKNILGDLKDIKHIDISHEPDEKFRQTSGLTYEERMKRLSTQTLLSEYSIRMSTSEHLDTDQTIENRKIRRHVDADMLESDVLSLSFHNTDVDFQDLNSEKDEVFETDIPFSSEQYEKPLFTDIISKFTTLSTENLTSNISNLFENNSSNAYQNYGYQNNIEDVKIKKVADLSSNSAQKNSVRHIFSQSAYNNEIYLKSYKTNTDNYKSLPENLKNLSNSEFSDIDNFKTKHGKLATSTKGIVTKSKETTAFASLSIIFDPMFGLIAIIHAVYIFVLVCMMTVIVDFARDLNIGISNEKYILMALSVGNLIGRLGLGWITDGGFMSSTNFAALCFAVQGVVTSAIVWSDGFITLMILITLYGFSEASIIVIYPIIIAQYIDPAKQTVAIPASSFLGGPLCLAVSPLIVSLMKYILPLKRLSTAKMKECVCQLHK